MTLAALLPMPSSWAVGNGPPRKAVGLTGDLEPVLRDQRPLAPHWDRAFNAGDLGPTLGGWWPLTSGGLGLTLGDWQSLAFVYEIHRVLRRILCAVGLARTEPLRQSP